MVLNPIYKPPKKLLAKVLLALMTVRKMHPSHQNKGATLLKRLHTKVAHKNTRKQSIQKER